MALLDSLFGANPGLLNPNIAPQRAQQVFDPSSMTMVDIPVDPYAEENAKLEAARRMQMKPGNPLPFAGMLSNTGLLNTPGGIQIPEPAQQASPFESGTSAVPFMSGATSAPPLPRPTMPPVIAETPADAAIPPAAQPTQAMAEGPGSRFLSGLSNSLSAHPLTLMALGAGFAGAPSFGTGMSRAFASAVPAASAEQKMQIQQQGIAQTYKALVARGVPPQEALAAVYNPDVMKATAVKYFETKVPEWKQVGADIYGNPQYGLVDVQKGTINGVPMSQAGSAGITTTTGSPPDNNLVGDEYLAQYPQELQAAVKNYIAGQSMPTGNARKGFTQAVKMVAQKYGQDIGVPVDDTTFVQRRQYRNQLASANPSSAGGQKITLGTALGHLSDVAKYAEDLGNVDAGIPLLSHGINWARAHLSTEQAAKVQKISEAVDRFAGEVGKLYSGSQGGGVQERETTRDRFGAAKSGPELAGAIEASRDLLHSRLQALENQRDQILGAAGKDVQFLSAKERQALVRIDEVLAKLSGKVRGNQPAAALTPGRYIYDPSAKRLVPAQ